MMKEDMTQKRKFIKRMQVQWYQNFPICCKMYARVLVCQGTTVL